MSEDKSLFMDDDTKPVFFPLKMSFEKSPTKCTSHVNFEKIPKDMKNSTWREIFAPFCPLGTY